MKVRTIVEGLYQFEFGGANAYLLDGTDTLVLIDTGSPGGETEITAALGTLGYKTQDLTHIIITHMHADHAGSLAALQANSTAQTLMHDIDAAFVRRGDAMRPLSPAPQIMARLLFPFVIAPTPHNIEPATVDATVEDGDVIAVAGGLRVIHTPGHSAGQIALVWEARRVLFAADAVINVPRLGYHLGYEDFVLGQRTAQRLSELSFDIACFGHGRPILSGADQAFRRKFQLQQRMGSPSNHQMRTTQ